MNENKIIFYITLGFANESIDKPKDFKTFGRLIYMGGRR